MENDVIGNLRKMRVRAAQPVEYELLLGDHPILLNAYLGKQFTLRFTGNIYCIQCERKINKSFQQGYCFPCLQRLMECNLCVIHPEKCNMQHGACPENDWAHTQCAQPHIVYLANSSSLKVGITRASQTPIRWIDQGAKQALPIFQAANRYQSGMIEMCLKQWINDRTDWRALLKKSADSLDLAALRDDFLKKAADSLQAVAARFPGGAVQPILNGEVIELEYPVQEYPQKISALSFDQNSLIGGRLQGIKGQYLIFDTGVVNVRKFSGYEIEFNEES